MTYEFRQAQRSRTKPLIGLYAESGCGKTYSALLLARGFVGASGKIGMIETEAGRGEAYADLIPGGYTVLSLSAPFAPEAYGKAIDAAERQKLDALIIDSASHEWEGVGGVLDMAASNMAAGKKGPLVWQMPKISHSRQFMLRLLQTPISLVIVCMRAKYPMQEIKKADGSKEWIRSEILEPKQSDDILYEMFVHGWIDKEHKFHVTKLTRPDLAKVFVDGHMLSIETGRQLAAWSQSSPATALAASAPAGEASPLSPENLQGSPVEAGEDHPSFRELTPELQTLDRQLALASTYGWGNLGRSVRSLDARTASLLRWRIDNVHKIVAHEVSSQRKKELP